MIIIHHRRNLKAELEDTSPNFGVEIDIRSQGSELILQHDPYSEGESLEEWLEGYRHRLLILNVKEEGLEERLLTMMKVWNIDRFFFLDQTFPFLIKMAKQGERRCAARVSEFESTDTALALAGLVNWVWVDYFNRFPLSANSATQLLDAGLRLCLVSPELQGHNENTSIKNLRRLLDTENIPVDAVCTKRPDLWV